MSQLSIVAVPTRGAAPPTGRLDGAVQTAARRIAAARLAHTEDSRSRTRGGARQRHMMPFSRLDGGGEDTEERSARLAGQHLQITVGMTLSPTFLHMTAYVLLMPRHQHASSHNLTSA